MGKNTFSRAAYAAVATRVETLGKGTTHFAGAQRQAEGKGLDPLVDPAGYGLIRKSLPRYIEAGDDTLRLACGIPMLEETRFDTTGSMGGNVDLAFRSLPQMYSLLAEGGMPVLGRYDPQIINSIFGDVVDRYVLYRSQAEMDEKIAEQLTLMVPEKSGGDATEDPQYGLFGGAFLTDAFINRYGLKYYDFTVTDAPGRERLNRETLIRVFGPTVFDRVKENGHVIEEQALPTTKEVVAELQQRAHAFLIQIEESQRTTDFWTEIFGTEHLIVIPDTGDLPYVQAAVIGLTEGVIDLQSTEEYLRSVGCDADVARRITRSVAGIPIGAQATLPGFSKIPAKGSLFAKKGDLWPIDASAGIGVPGVGTAEEDGPWL